MQKLAYRTAEIDWEPKYPNFEIRIRMDEKHEVSLRNHKIFNCWQIEKYLSPLLSSGEPSAKCIVIVFWHITDVILLITTESGTGCHYHVGGGKRSENKVTEFLGSDCAGSPAAKHWPCVRAVALVALGRTSTQLRVTREALAPCPSSGARTGLWLDARASVPCAHWFEALAELFLVGSRVWV